MAAKDVKLSLEARDKMLHGIDILAITWPARQIVTNAGEDTSIIVGKILENDTYAYGYDAQTGQFGNMVAWSTDWWDRGPSYPPPR
jgi:chaperonin GroEL